jgi:predicted GNAT family acetyltransferase
VKPEKTEDISISHQAGRQRYELALDGELAAFADYRRRGDNVDFVHTEVLAQHQGRGLARQLARFALDDVRAQGRQAVATCSFIAGYVERHPQYRDLLVGVSR